MRRSQTDKGSQIVRNFAYNPSFEAAGITTALRTNNVINPSMETAGSATAVRTNILTNPSAEVSATNVNVRTNLATNPSFEGASGTINVRANTLVNPSMETASGTVTTRINLMTNPSLTTNSTGWSVYGGGQTFSDLTISRAAVTWAMSGWAWKVQGSATALPNYAEIGLGDYTLAAGTAITASVYVMASGARNARIRVRGIGGGGDTFSPDFALNASIPTRIYFSTTVPVGATGVSINIKEGTTNDAFGASDWIAASAALVETTSALLPYFDGTRPASENIVKVAPSAYNGLTITTGISYAGSTWSRGAAPISGAGSMARQMVALADLRQGERYTTSVTVANDQAFTQQVTFDMADTGGASFIINPGEVRRITVTGTRTSYDTTFRFADLDVSTSATETRSILFKDWLIEVGTTAGDYYTGTGDFTYIWVGTADASTSAQRANGIANWLLASTAATFQSTVQKNITGKSLGIATKGGNGDGVYSSDISGLVAGASYTFSAWIKQTTAHPLTMVFRWKDGAQGLLNDSTVSVTPTVGQWTRVSATAVAPTGSVVYLQPMIRIYAAHTGTTFYVDDALMERASGLGTYFDGATTAAGDFTYTWAGTANASQSYQQAPAITGWSNRWFGNGGGNGAMYQAKGGLSGTYARKLWTSANTTLTMDAGIGTATSIPVSSSMVYTLSAWVRASFGQYLNYYIEWRDAGNAVISATQMNTGTLVTANTWTRLSVTATSPSNATAANFVLGPYAQAIATPYGATLDFDNVLIEAAPSVQDYFDGANPIQNLITNSSFETDTSGWAVGTLGSRDTSKTYTGIASMKVDTSSSGAYTGVATTPTLVVGQVYTISAYFWAPTGTTVNFAADALGVNTGVVGNNAWQRASLTGTYVSGGVFYFRSTSANQAAFWIDGILLERSSALSPYYEGLGDYTYVWAGTAHASVSYQQAPGVSGVSMAPSLCYAYQSKTVGISSGTKSIRITPTHVSNGDSFAELGMIGSYVFKPNTTYTISGNRTIIAPQTNIAGTTHFRINVGTELTPSLVASVANVAGTQRVVARFTTGSGTGLGFIRVYNGSAFGGGDVWWDDIVLEEGTTNGSYFDGTSPIQNLVTNSSFETDTSGWLANTGTPTLTSDSTVSWVGGKSLKAVSTVTSADIAVFMAATLAANTTYTMSWYVYSPNARTAYLDVSGNPAINFANLGSKAIPANTWTRVSATFTMPSAVNGNTTFYLHHGGGPTTIGSILYIDAVLLERSSTLGPYYAGLGDFTYAWTGTANASTSQQSGVMVSDRQSVAANSSTYQSGVRALTGTKSGAIRTANDVLLDGTLMYPATEYWVGTSISASVSNTWSVWVWVPSGSGTVRLVDVTTGSVGAANTTFDAWERISVTFTGIASGQHVLRLRAYTTIPAGTTIWWDNELLEAANAVRPYFDGSTVLNDFTYLWNGAVNYSTSTQRAVYAADVGNSGTAFCIQSSDWATSGSKSVRVITTAAGEPEAGLNTARMEFGKTYTILAKLRINKVAVGSTSRARRINFYNSNNNQQSFFTQVGTTSPNAIGVYDHRLTVTIPADTTHIYLRLGGHSSVAFDADAWWDDLMIVEGNYTGDYVDGTKPLSKWDGTANSAVSIGYPPQLLDIAGKPDMEVVGAGNSANPTVDGFTARTIYLVYEVTDNNSGSWQVPMFYGSAAPTTGLTIQTAASGNFTMSPRMDFTAGGGDINKGFNFPNGRTVRIHVLAMSFNNGLTSVSGSLDGAANGSVAITPGTVGWTSGQLRNYSLTGVRAVRSMVYYADHDAATRTAVSRYLGNKYGAYVA